MVGCDFQRDRVAYIPNRTAYGRIDLDAGVRMLKQIFMTWGVVALAWTSVGGAQTKPARSREPVSSGRPLSAWIADLEEPAPETRNAAAYEIAGIGPEAAAAVPALIAALDDPVAAVRFPVTVALLEIGPAAKAAIPRLREMMDEEINDEIAASARRALKRIDPAAVPPE
jgi:HEAT repeat protein